MTRRLLIVAVRALVLLASVLAPEPLPGQAAPNPALPVGERVRVRTATSTGDDLFAGTLVTVRSESLFVEVSPGLSPRVAPLSEVRQLWVSRGRTGRATGKGALAGAILGGLALGAAAAISEAGACEELTGGFGGGCWGAGFAFLVGFGIGALPGATIGAIVGHSRRSERWERIR